MTEEKKPSMIMSKTNKADPNYREIFQHDDRARMAMRISQQMIGAMSSRDGREFLTGALSPDMPDKIAKFAVETTEKLFAAVVNKGWAFEIPAYAEPAEDAKPSRMSPDKFRPPYKTKSAREQIADVYAAQDKKDGPDGDVQS